MEVAVWANYAFVVDDDGLQVVQLRNSTNLVLVSGSDTLGPAVGVAVATNYACQADGYAGLWVIDLSNPTNLALVGGYDTPGTARGVAVSGS